MISPIQIPPTNTLEELRLAVTASINQLISQLNIELGAANLSGKGNRIINVGEPVSLTDATTKRWVLNQLEKL